MIDQEYRRFCLHALEHMNIETKKNPLLSSLFLHSRLILSHCSLLLLVVVVVVNGQAVSQLFVFFSIVSV